MKNGIESRDESYALQAAATRIAEVYPLPILSNERELIRLAWIAGRDWQRSQDAARRGFRLLGCTHTPGCGSASQCAERN